MANGMTGARTSGLGHCPLVLGECVQGCLEDGRHFLITSPIGLFSWAEFTWHEGLERLEVFPPDRIKARRAVAGFLEASGLGPEGKLRVHTPLESTHGFGTSTADVVSAVRAAAAFWAVPTNPDAVASLAASIEPTDGSMYPGCVAFAQREGRLLESLGPLPRLEAVVAFVGESIDTVAFDKVRESFRYSREALRELRRAWEIVRAATRTGDVPSLARATTISARINQQFVPKPHFDEFLRLVERAEVDGLMAAHSGSVVALLMDPLSPDHARRLKNAERVVDELGVEWFRLSSHQTFLDAASRPVRVGRSAS